MTKPTKLPRIPGFKYAPRLIECDPFDGTNFRVQQSAFWMDAGVKGPCKPTRPEAIRAWKRLCRRLVENENRELKAKDAEIAALKKELLAKALMSSSWRTRPRHKQDALRCVIDGKTTVLHEGAI